MPEMLFADREEAAARIPATARELTGLADYLGNDYLMIWLDETTRTVWIAQGSDEGWYLEDHPVPIGLREVHEHAQELLAGLVDPAMLRSGWEQGLADLYDVELIAFKHGLGRGPYASAYDVDQRIQAAIDAAKAEVSRLAGLRAHHIRTRYGTGRGSGAKAAQGLRVSPPTISTLLAADARRRAALHADASGTSQQK